MKFFDKNFNNYNEKHLYYIDSAIEKAHSLYDSCICCGHLCKTDRNNNKIGRCKIFEDTSHIKVASHTLHFGEEPMLVGNNGSGTVFFSNCNLSCVFCQNHQISSEGIGEIIDLDKLASYFLDLEREGANNINLVSATHVIYPVLKALKIALLNGLNLPIVYNTNGYDTNELLDCLNGIIDIYLPDLKYFNNEKAIKYSRAENYFDVAINAITIMKNQVGDLIVDENDIAKSGIIIRHLVLPNNESDSYDILIELKERGFLNSYISLMSQYSPEFMAKDYDNINRKLYVKEYNEVLNFALDLGFENILGQEMESSENYLPDFRKDKPFE
ncbi:radical SAM protein [Brachyspira pilosicoli]|uniref:Pyruvate formate-lyase 1-activating enzyme n=1 Tax=Brachyspira pilosicoli (strain ATCC BAA-1826 / 95/1000) TaxID=759914 RepID=D8IC74_BRAP9|nr:radical SAM protein [Brachyspira pilosicoli]ADK30747.1 pyruvate formate-lyase 1-activating enzyme [Brachyspira pilosicoli 95/1000]PLV57944.1 pyruvate formate lyase activating Fe-S protein PflX [Brachyspira pilosicoli SP16]WIH83439.1 radical SAM protein [Brachyspira pilosicoli]